MNTGESWANRNGARHTRLCVIYASEDALIARKLVDALESRGWGAWSAEELGHAEALAAPVLRQPDDGGAAAQHAALDPADHEAPDAGRLESWAIVVEP